MDEDFGLGFEEFGFDDDDDDVSGEAIYTIGDDGVLYEVGRRGKRRRRRRRANRGRNAMPALPSPGKALRPAPRAVEVLPAGAPMRHTLDASGMRRQPLGFNPVTLLAGPGTSGIVEVNVQREFQGERLILAATDPATGNDVSGLVQLTGFLVASDNQLPSGAPQSLIGYRYDAIGAGMMTTPAVVGAIIRLSFLNLGATDAVVAGVFYGMTRA